MTNEILDPGAGAPGAGAACARVAGRLTQLVDGALAPLDAARDGGHLEACASCRQTLARHTELLSSLRRLSLRASERDVVEDIARVAAAVRARLDRSPPSPRAGAWASWPARATRRRMIGFAVAAAAVLLLATLESWASLPSLDPARLARLDWPAELPSWSEVVRGLESLARRIS